MRRSGCGHEAGADTIAPDGSLDDGLGRGSVLSPFIKGNDTMDMRRTRAIIVAIAAGTIALRIMFPVMYFRPGSDPYAHEPSIGVDIYEPPRRIESSSETKRQVVIILFAAICFFALTYARSERSSTEGTE